MSNTATQETTRLPRFVPASDILETEDGFHIRLDMPGVDKKDVTMDLKENELVIEAMSAYAPPNGATAIHTEFEAGRYQRTFALSDMVDRDNIKAGMKEGVLEVFLPRAEASMPRKIAIE